MAEQGEKEPGNDLPPPSMEYCSSSIKIPKIYESFVVRINPQMIQIIQSSVQFYGLPDEDPYKHIADFLQICDTFFGPDDSYLPDMDKFKLVLFPFSLASKAKDWLYYSHEPESITTWDTLASEFLAEYFPARKTIELREEILNFYPYGEEPLYMQWRRYKVLLRKCPHHGLPLSRIVNIFYGRLDLGIRRRVDEFAGGSLLTKCAEKGYTWLQRFAADDKRKRSIV